MQASWVGSLPSGGSPAGRRSAAHDAGQLNRRQKDLEGSDASCDDGALDAEERYPAPVRQHEWNLPSGMGGM